MTVTTGMNSQPEWVSLVQPDVPHSAEVERAMAEKTSALAHRTCGETNSLTWPYYNVAPWAAVTATGAYTFSVGSKTDSSLRATLQIPHRVSEIATAVLAVIEYCASRSLAVQLGINGKQMVDTYTTDTGSLTHANFTVGALDQHIGWRGVSGHAASAVSRFTTAYNMQSVRCVVNVDNLPSTRLIVIEPKLYASMSYGRHEYSGGSSYVYIKSMVITDLPRNAVGVWT